MGRGRQKAKQQKIARKLKYLTTDTDYDELAKELSAREPGEGSPDPFAEVEEQYSHAGHRPVKPQVSKDVPQVANQRDSAAAAAASTSASSAASADASVADDDLDDYAKWAAEAAAKAVNQAGDKSIHKKAVPKPHKPIHMPMPSALRKPRPSKA
ncbi:DUF3073 domain-containing protein [Bifidobacterium sp. ESL0790]|uniref:DUF3073 domain-containing protein n=1 Tax=Bifidobacterium sp. ESL0790 TaxID=2983233 RepID=UPI0023F65025|nr:DUF3073 domain-containing protein [Bifidobacterium sp. ESL0790]WEV72451.1 DUF3073 domain-containing protein [Bifidobacterium sp. ESL0790]